MGHNVKVSRKPKEKEYIAFIRKAIKKWHVFAISLAICLAGIVLFNKLVTPVYRIGAKLLIKQEGRAGMSTSGGGRRDFNAINSIEQTYSAYNEMHVVQSAELVEKSILNLNLNVSYYSRKDLITRELYKDPPFVVVFDPSYPQPVDVKFTLKFLDKNTFILKINEKDVEIYRFKDEKTLYSMDKLSFDVKVKIGQDIKTNYCSFKVLLNNGYSQEELTNRKFFFSFNSMPDLVYEYGNSLTTSTTHQFASVLVIDMKSKNIDKGIDFLNELMDQYMKENLEKKNHYANITLEYIESQIGQISDTLSYTAKRMQDYQARYQVIDIPTKAGSLTQQLQTLKGQKADAEIKHKYYEYINEYLTNKNKDITDLVAPSSMGIEESLLNNLIQELATLNAEKKSLIDNNQELNPYLNTIESRIENIKKTIIENVKYSLNTSKLSIQDLEDRIQRITREIRQLPANERELADIRRLYNLSDAVYTNLLQRHAEAQIAKASNLPDNSVIEKARMIGDSPVFPKRKANLVIGLFLGFIIPIGIILYKEANEDKIVDVSEISDYTDFSIIGTVLRNDTKSTLAMSEFPKSAMAESIRSIRTNLQYYGRTNKSQVILVTSSIGQEGKSMVSASLALSYTMNDYKTLLVGFDLRKPMLNDYLKINSALGVSTFLINAATLDDIIVETQHANLHYIASGDLPPNPSELIHSPETKVLFDLLREMYDYIIVDTAPLGLVSDTYMLMNHSDINLFLVRQNITPRSMFSQIMEEIENKQISNLALVMNDFSIHRKSYGYKYGYYQKSKKKRKKHHKNSVSV